MLWQPARTSPCLYQFSNKLLTNKKSMKNLTVFDGVALLVLVIGGINWGLISIFNVDIVSTLFGVMTTLTRVVYVLVGVSALYTVYIVTTKTQFESL